jgi:hypothetical protein
MVHVLGLVHKGRQTRARKSWKYEEGYIKWFYRVSHPMIAIMRLLLNTQLMSLLIEEVVGEQQWVRQLPDQLQIILNIRVRVDSAMGHHDVFLSPIFTVCCRASSRSITICRRSQFPEGGLEVVVHKCIIFFF